MHRDLKQIQNVRYRLTSTVDDLSLKLLDQLVDPDCIVRSCHFGKDILVTLGYDYQFEHFATISCTSKSKPVCFDTTFNLGILFVLFSECLRRFLFFIFYIQRNNFRTRTSVYRTIILTQAKGCNYVLIGTVGID
jgi:hypothetical protein